MAKDYASADAQAPCGADILSNLGVIEHYLSEAHAICHEIHGSQPVTKGHEKQSAEKGSRLDLVEQRVSHIEFSIRELTARLRNIVNRLG